MGVLYENTLLGNSTMSGWSPTAMGSGTGAFTVSMSGALLITKAYLIAGCCGVPASPLTVILNNGITATPLTFSAATRVSAPFQTAFQNNTGLSSVHAIDVTSLISLTATNYTLTVPQQLYLNNAIASVKYSDFFLFIEYFTGGAKTTSQVFINENNMANLNSRTLNFIDGMNNTKPVGMSLMTGYCCNNTVAADATNILVNATLLGHIGSTTGDSGCGGAGFINVIGNYKYGSQVLTAGANCNINQAVSGLDCLSDIKALVALNATTYTLQFNCTSVGNVTNNLWGVITTYVNTTATYEGILCSYITPTVSSITTSGATVNWCSQGAIANFQNRVQWRAGGQTIWLQSGVLTNVSTYNITGLISNTPYEYRVVNIDADGAVLQPSAVQRFLTA